MKNLDKETIFGLSLIAIFIVLVGTALFFSIYAFVMYWDKPITEVPMWALWFLQRG